MNRNSPRHIFFSTLLINQHIFDSFEGQPFAIEAVYFFIPQLCY